MHFIDLVVNKSRWWKKKYALYFRRTIYIE